MTLPIFTARCTRHSKIAHEVFEFALEKPVGFSFKAGQFVMFQVPLIGNPADIQGRAFSIASAPSEADLLFVAKIKQGGRAGRWISEVLKAGDEVKLQGPLGAFTLAPGGEGGLLFIATCTGVAPLRSQIVEALARGDARSMDLFFCVRSEEDLFWADELGAIAREHKNLRVHLTLSRPSPAWKGLTGHVQDVAPQVIADLSARSILVCGAPEMVKAVKTKATEEWGIPKERVHAEDYV